MKTVPEILTGKPRSAWGREEVWGLRLFFSVFGGFLVGFVGFLSLSLQPFQQLSHRPILTLAIAFAVFLFVRMVRVFPLPPPPES